MALLQSEANFIRQLETATTPNQTVFTFPSTIPTDPASMLVTVDGIGIDGDFSITGVSQITLDSGVPIGTDVEVMNGTILAINTGAVGADNTIQFASLGAFASSNNLVFTPTGRLGIGTDNPQARLDFHDDGNPAFRITDTSADVSAPEEIGRIEWFSIDGGGITATIKIRSEENFSPGNRKSSIIFSSFNDTTLDEHMRILGNGNIGTKGITAPDVALHIGGDIKATGLTANTILKADSDKKIVAATGDDIIINSHYVGELIMFAGSTAPTNWVFCDGQTLSATTFPALFVVIGFTYGGSGDNFNMPDLRGRVPVGEGQGVPPTNRVLAATGGAETHTLVESEIPSHNHAINGSSTTGEESNPIGNFLAALTNSYIDALSPSGALGDASISDTGGNGTHNNMQPFIVMNYIICTTGVAP